MKGINHILDKLISSGRSGDVKFDSDGLLESLAKTEHQPKHFWEIPFQKGLRLALVLSAALMMLTVILYYGFRYINDVLLYEHPLTVNEQGAFNPRKPLNCEYALYLFNTADLWANSGIQVNEKDRIRITVSGGCNSTVEGTVVAAENNKEQDYPWISYPINNKEKKDTKGLEHCISSKPNNSLRNKESYDFGTILYTIMPESSSLSDYPLKPDSIYIYPWEKGSSKFQNAGQSGTLYFAVNDMYFSDDEEMVDYYTNSTVRNFNGKPFSEKEIEARSKLPKHDYDDNLGQLLVSVEIQRNFPGEFFYPSMAYRDLEYRVNETLDAHQNGFGDHLWGFFVCIKHFFCFIAWISVLFGLYLLTLLAIVYIIFLLGHWIPLVIEFLFFKFPRRVFRRLKRDLQ